MTSIEPEALPFSSTGTGGINNESAQEATESTTFSAFKQPITSPQQRRGDQEEQEPDLERVQQDEEDNDYREVEDEVSARLPGGVSPVCSSGHANPYGSLTDSQNYQVSSDQEESK